MSNELRSELARVKAELEAERSICCAGNKDEAQLWKQKAERYEAALEAIAEIHYLRPKSSEEIAKDALKGGVE